MPGRLLTLFAATAVTAIAVGVGVVVSDPAHDRGPAAPAPPPPGAELADVDTTTLTIPRTDFCAEVAPIAVERALGAEPSAADAYGNGDSAALTPRVTDIAHEYHCRWTAGKATARAWVFTPPVTPKQAARLARQAGAAAECREIPGAPAFGAPSTALACDSPSGREVSFRGLFGDAWLVCSLAGEGPVDDLTDRAGRWCAAVAQGASA